MSKKAIFILILLILSLGAFYRISTEKRSPVPEKIMQNQNPGDTIDWQERTVIYNLDVEVFKDSDRDGIGDFKGLTERLGYIDSLGANAIWLAPFQPTPNKDDGYDVANYYAVDNRLGTMQDFEKFLEKASEMDIKVVMDLVINHTSIEHPWFQKSRRGESGYKDWYTWSEEEPRNRNLGMVFPGTQEEIWTYDSLAEAYYFHRFYRFQPGLNNHNKEVQEEVKEIIRFWMEKGIKGFRLDAVPFMLEKPEKQGEEFEHDFELLKDIRQYVNKLDEDAILLGEANVKPENNEDYLIADEGLHMMFNFFVNQHIFYALATSEIEPLRSALERTRDIPTDALWAQFLRNHDEVDLGRLSKEQRQEVFAAMGPEEHMQLYNRGIRRRLAPMLSNNRDRLELAYSLLLSLPSVPVMRYGDEIGMGDDLSLEERLAVRTPMQWSDEKNAGFTKNDTAVRPVIDSGEYSYETINVEEAKADSTSLLNWTINMVELRKNNPEIDFGEWEILDGGTDQTLILKYTWKDEKLLVIHNMNPSAQELTLETKDLEGKRLSDLLSPEQWTLPEKEISLQIEGYNYKWLSIEE